MYTILLQITSWVLYIKYNFQALNKILKHNSYFAIQQKQQQQHVNNYNELKLKETVDMAKQIHHELCTITSCINDTFNIQLLLILCYFCIISMWYVYMLITEQEISYQFFITVLINILTVCTTIYVCDSIGTEVILAVPDRQLVYHICSFVCTMLQ